MFRIRKSEFHFWFSFPNLSPEIAAKSPQKTGSKLTQKRPDEGLYIDARIGSCINNLKKFIKMATTVLSASIRT